MSLLDEKIKELIDELHYSDAKIVKTDRKSVELIMKEIVDFTLAIIVPIENNEEIINTINNFKNDIRF